jgi:hypothetical protein
MRTPNQQTDARNKNSFFLASEKCQTKNIVLFYLNFLQKKKIFKCNFWRIPHSEFSVGQDPGIEMATSANKSRIYRKIVFQTKAREACIEKHKFHVCSTTCKEFEK